VSVYLEPAGVEEELQQGENRDVHVQFVTTVSFLRVQELSTNYTESKKRVNCNSYHLRTSKEKLLQSIGYIYFNFIIKTDSEKNLRFKDLLLFVHIYIFVLYLLSLH